jgi:hypothetical protein
MSSAKLRGPEYAGSSDGLTPREREATAIRASYIAQMARTTETRRTCATCRGEIPPGARFREDRLQAPVFGELLVSAICLECVAEGL